MRPSRRTPFGKTLHVVFDLPSIAPLVIFVTSFVVALSGAVIPGPVLTVVISETVRRGFWAGPTIVLGHGLLELVTVAVVAAGVQLLHPSDGLVAMISLAGVIALLWIARGLYRTGRYAREVDLTPRDMPRGWRLGGLVGMGAIVSLANPFWTIWWLTIGATYVLWSLQAALVGIVSFYIGHVLGDLAWYAGVSALVARGRRYLSLRAYRGVLYGCAVFLVGLAMLFLASAARALV